MSLKLYFDFMSQPSRAVYILLKTCKIPFESCPVALRKAEHLTEQYKKDISRFQQVPVLKDGNYTLTESVAMLRYIAREKQVPDQWYPKDSKLQSRVDEYLEWQHIGLRAFCGMYFRTKWLEPLVTGESPNPEQLAYYKEKLIKALDEVEEFFLKDKMYITGDHITAADIWAACEIEQPRVAGYDPTVGRPILTKWLNNVRKSLSPHYEEAHAILNKFVAAGQKK